MSTEAQLKAISNSELASGNQIPALKHRTVNNAIIEEMYDAQSRGDVLAGVQSAVSIASGDQVLVIRSGQAYLLDSSEFGFVDALADLTDVSIPTPANDQVLAYNTATSKWVAKDVNTLTSVVSISGTATTNALTKFTGTSSIGNSNISDDGSTIALTGNLAVNTNDLYINSSNSRVGIGTASPSTTLHVVGNILADFVSTTGNSYTKIFNMDQDIETTDAVEFLTVTAGSFITTGGTSSQFVKGNGTLDSTDYQDTSEKGQANGYAPLDSGAKVAEAYLPDSILGQVSYQGTWDASTNTPTLANPPASTTKGEYYVTSVAGTQFSIDFQVGDWVISNGTSWEKVDNTDAVTSVFGRLGNIVANESDYASFYVDFDSDQSITGQKTFGSGDLRIVSGGSGNLPTIFINSSVGSSTESGFNSIGFNGSNDFYFTKGVGASFNGAIFSYDNAAIRTYTLQDASGTLAFTSDINDTLDSVTDRGATTTNAITVGDTTVVGDLNIDGGKITIDTTAIVGREDILLSTVSDNTDDKFGIANGTTTSNRFIPTFYGYTNGAYQSMIFRGLGDVTYDDTASPPLVEFLATNTNSSTDPNNGTLTAITNRPVFNFGTTGYSYMRILPSGHVGLGNNTNPQATLDVSGNAIISGNLTVDTNTLFVDAANNRVGIGTSSVDSNLVVNGSSSVRVNLKAGDVRYGTIFADSGVLALASITSIPLVLGTNDTERMRIDSSGNVGIGTSTLNNISGSNPTLTLAGTGITGGLILQNSGTDTARIYETGNLLIYQGMSGIGHSFYVNAVTEAMRIDSSGNVGIGTSSTGAKLEVAGGATFNGDLVTGAEIYRPSTDSYLRINGASSGVTGASILMFGDTHSSAAGRLALTAVGSESVIFNTGGSERMRIDSSGNVGIGLTNPSAQLHVNSNMYVGIPNFVGSAMNTVASAVFARDYNWVAVTDSNYLQRCDNTDGAVLTFIRGTSIVGSVTVTASATSYNTSSDYRLKENVVPMEGALERVDALKPSRFNFIADPEKTVDGFLAHEAAEVVPEAVTGEKDAVDEEGNPEYQGIDQSKLVPLLVGAIQELKKIVDNQKAEIETLKQQINGQ